MRASWAVVVAVLAVAVTVLTVLVAAGWPPLAGMDGEVALALAAAMPAHPVAVAVMVVVTDVGGPVSVNLLTGAAVVVLLLRRRVRVAAYLIAVRLCVLVVETALKDGLGRPRPPIHPLTSASGFSFPSGHAGGTAALCVSVLFVLHPAVHHRWRVVVVAAAVLLSVAVAVSRVALGVHYPSDVVGGLLVGVLCGVVLMPVVERRRPGISSVRAGPPDGRHGDGMPGSALHEDESASGS
jgi:undecaprenyl-diphosphatase